MCIKNDHLGSQNSAKTDCDSGGCGKWVRNNQPPKGADFITFPTSRMDKEVELRNVKFFQDEPIENHRLLFDNSLLLSLDFYFLNIELLSL